MTSLHYSGGHREQGVRLSRMIILSLVVHVALLSLAVFWPTRTSTPRFTLGPVYSVQLVNLSDTLMSHRQMSDPLRDLAGPSLREQSLVMKKRVTTQTAPPIRKMETKKNLSNPAVENLRKKLGAKPSTANARSESSPAANSADSAEANSQLAEYYTVIWSRIKSQWNLPGGLNPKDNVEAVVQVRIMQNGTITGISFEKKSGLAYFDNSVLRALKKANPLPPLPPWYRENGLDLGIRFLSSDLRR
ncbi:MAG: energy transducer TonB [Syntrophus sp. (in: bacteria)]